MEQLSVGYTDEFIVRNLDLAIPDGQITALVGANGSGKSTILKTMARLMKAKSGHVYLDGKSITRLPSRDLAKELAILPQNPVAPDGLTVRELVSYGRFPYQRGFGTLTRTDREMIDWALSVTGMETLADRLVDQMSGGQRQRAWIAMALAQGTDILFLDEPTTFLDIAHQLEVLELLERLHREQKRTIVMVLHDLNHAARYAHYIVAIRHGEAIYRGTPNEVIHEQMCREVFGIEADIIPDPRTGTMLCIPHGLARVDQASKV